MSKAFTKEDDNGPDTAELRAQGPTLPMGAKTI